VGIEKQGRPDHKFQYNGKEKQEELGLHWNDYGARFYDPQLSRWHVVDKSAEEYYHITPYSYVNNNAVRNIDPDGKDGFDTVKGILVSTVDNVTGGAVNLRGRVSYNDARGFNAGQDLGDMAAATAGLYMMVDGGGKLAGGLTLAGASATLAGPTGGFTSPGIGAGLTIAGAGAIEGTAGYALFSKSSDNYKNQKGRVQNGNTNPKKAAREAAKEKREIQPASEKYAKYKAKELEKNKGKDARREAHDKKEGLQDRTKKQINEDYK
jgi:RHS repeat-associated protein